MSNILILHTGLEGMSNACLELAKRLESRGHTIHTATMRNKRDKIESNSLRYLDVKSVEINYIEDKSVFESIQTTIFSKKSFYDSLYARLNFADFQNTLKAIKIDLVLIDVELHEYISYCSAHKVPFLLITQWFSNWKSSKNMPIQSCLTPQISWRNKVAWKYHGLKGVLKTYGHSIKTIGINRRSFLFYLNRRFNLNLKNLRSFHFPLPYSYKNIEAISLTHPSLEFSIEHDAPISYVYPMVFENRSESITDQFLSDYSFIKNEKQTKDLKLIISTHTTMKNAKIDGLSNLLNALVGIENAVSIVSVGDQYSEELRTKYFKRGVFIYKSIPQIKALSCADLCINHGGIHTINECIHFKVPMVVLSGNRHDQNGCAVRISEYGCGITTCKKNHTTADISKYINQVLSDSNYKSKIDDLYRSYQDAKNNKIAEIAIEAYLSKIN